MPWCPDSDDNGALLITACNAIEADLLESKLKAYGIPVLRKYKGFGDYLNIYMGATPFGVDLYVPAELLEKARDIVSIQDVPDDSPEPAQMQEDGGSGHQAEADGESEYQVEMDGAGHQVPEEDTSPAKVHRQSALVIVAFIPVLFFVVFILYRLLKYLLGG